MENKKTKIIVKEDDCYETLSESVETIINNEDLVTEILVHVPAKSLIKLKCVCKDWNSLISSSQFVYNQCTRNTKLVSGIYFHNYRFCDALECLSHQGHLSSVNLPFLHELKNGEKPCLEHSCNGLTLLRDSLSYNYYVCNLTTRKYVKLPQYPRGIGYTCHARLAFDPLSSPHYKVILMFPTICIYFSGNKSWRTVLNDETPYVYPVAFLDGAIHWMNEKYTYCRFIVDEERLIKTQLPPRPKLLNVRNIRFFGECCGQLLLIQCRLRSVMGFTILEMKRGTCHWTMKHRVNLRHVPHVQPTKGRNFHVLAILKETMESDLTLVLATPGKLFSYNFKRQTLVFIRDTLLREFESLTCFQHHVSSLGVGRCFPFAENLFPVDLAQEYQV